MTPSRLGWGLLLITAGVMLLLNQSGHLDWDYWLDLLEWWPLILIAIGLEKIFSKTKLKFISYLAPLTLVAAMVWVAVDVGPDRWSRSFTERYNWKTELDKSVEKIDAVIDHGRRDLTVSRSGINLASVKFDRATRKPDIDFKKSDGIAELKISSTGERRSPIIISGRGYYRDWRASFTDEVPLQLKCTGYESDVDLNLEMIPVEMLTVDNDDGNIYMKIGSRTALVKVHAGGDNADVRIRLPEGCGVKIEGSEYESYLKALELVESEGGFVSEGFGEADTKVSFYFEKGLQHLSITYY